MLEIKKDGLYRDNVLIDIKTAYKYMHEQLQLNEECEFKDIINILEQNENELNDILGFYLNEKSIRQIIDEFNILDIDNSRDGKFGVMAVWSASLHDHSLNFQDDISDYPGISVEKSGAVKFIFDLPIFVVTREIVDIDNPFEYNYMLVDIPLYWVKDAYLASFPSYIVRDGEKIAIEYNRLMSLYDVLRGLLMACTSGGTLNEKMERTISWEKLCDLGLNEMLDIEDMKKEPYLSLIQQLEFAIEKEDLDVEEKIYKTIRTNVTKVKQLQKLQIKK